MKPTKIKAWPELVDYLPCLTASIEPRKSKNNSSDRPIEIDFSSVEVVNSTGLTIFLLRILKVFEKTNAIKIRMCENELLEQEIERLGLINLLIDKTAVVQHELPLSATFSSNQKYGGSNRFSFPICRLTFDRSTTPHRAPRLVVEDFVVQVYEQLNHTSDVYNLEPNSYAMLLNEIAKNAADHSASDALFGLDITPIDSELARLSFAFGDLGVGIKTNLEGKYLPERLQRKAHLDLAELYRFALSPGFTSSSNTDLNKGQGMSLIVGFARGLNMKLSVFDASSRGLLSEIENIDEPSYTAVRRLFHNVGHRVGFFYFGECIVARRKLCTL